MALTRKEKDDHAEYMRLTHLHTPGPWMVNKSKRSLIDAPSVNRIIAEARGGELEERMANARLIAAAPELKAYKDEMNELANALRHPMFADRETLQEAYDYAMGIAKKCGQDAAYVITAIHVLMNTISNEIAPKPIKEKTDEYKDHLCGDECDISQCPEEPCHCDYGMTQLSNRAEIRTGLARDAISDKLSS